MQLENFQVLSPIIEQGEPSNNKLYIIIQGSVSIIVKKDTNVY